MVHNEARSLLMDVISLRVISNRTRLVALEGSSLNTGLAFGSTSGGAPSNYIPKLDNRIKVLE